MIYQHVSTRTKILPLATSYIAHLCNQFNHVLKALIFIKIKFFLRKLPLKLRYFCKRNANPRASCGCRLYPQPPVAGGFAPRLLKHPLSIANFWLCAWCFYCCFVILCRLILRLAGAYGFPQAAISLHKFAHRCTRPLVD